MERLSDKAICIINELMIERLHYFDEYIPLIDAANELAYYEDLKEQGRLIVIASDEDQLKTFEDKCWICPNWNGESCNKTQCLIYIRKEELRTKLNK